MMQEITKQKGGVWAMPIRKLLHLAYPFEQLHGRCAALQNALPKYMLKILLIEMHIVIKVAY